MKVAPRSNKTTERRIKMLENLGFRLEESDESRVKVSEDLVVDFSAIDEAHFMQHAIRRIWDAGYHVGRKSIREDFKTLLGIKE